ncbi:hypothetical protein [Kribbella sp. CA-294648]|uniref:hypothetical protein n=1 Tax=Kribbella sp. CA-294648 TaxID=3239948 RepID=UPI003D8DCFFC
MMAATLMGGVGATALTAAPAAAAGTIPFEVRAISDTTMSPGKVETAECPPGTVVIGGAYGSSLSAGLVLDDMAPISKTQFRVAVQAADPQFAPWSIVAIAMCAAEPKGYQIVKSPMTSTVTSFEQRATATCPTGKQVIGAGARLDGSPGDVVLDEILPSLGSGGKQSVSVKGFEEDAGNGAKWRITAFAVCSNPLPGRHVATTSSGINSNTSNQARATCQPGTAVISTAFDMIGSLGQASPASTLRTGLKSVAFTDAVEQLGGTNNQWGVASYAICASTVTN